MAWSSGGDILPACLARGFLMSGFVNYGMARRFRTAGLMMMATLLAACGGSGGDDDAVVTPNPGNRAPEVVLDGPTRLAAGGSAVFMANAEDPDGEIVSVTWAVAGALTVVEESEQRLTVSVPEAAADGEAGVTVTVTDDDGASAMAEQAIAIEAGDGAPRVDAGDDRRVDEAQPMTLSGSATVSADRSLRRLGWRQLDGPVAKIEGARDQNLLRITAPQVMQETPLTFELEAEDSTGALGRDTVTVTVSDVFDNPLPRVNAGDDRTVTAGQQLVLTGTASDDGSVVSVLWHVLPGGPALVLDGDDQLQVGVTVPPVSETVAARLRLTAEDDQGGRASDEVVLTIVPAPANAAPRIDDAYVDPGVARGGEAVDLIGAASDPDNHPLQYQWAQTDDGAAAVAINDADAAKAMVTLPEVAEATVFRFRLTVSDGDLQTDREVSVQVTPPGAPAPGVLQCLLSPLQSGCPLAVLGDLLDPAGIGVCLDDPRSPACPFSALANLDEGVEGCLRDPAAGGCQTILGKLTDPLYVLETLPQPEPANSCTPAYDERTFEHYLGTIHEHTGYSDGAISSRPADVFERTRGLGLDFTAVTDHSDNARLPLSVNGDCFSERFFECLIADDDAPFDSFRKWSATDVQARAATDDGFTAIRGFEWTSDRFGHINLLFGDNVINAKTGPGYAVSMGLFWQWFSYPAAFGGGNDSLLVFNHPGREDALEQIVDPLGGDPAYTFNDFRYVPAADRRAVGLEVFGKGSEYDSGGPGGSWLAYALDQGWHLGAVGSEDHHDQEWGDADLPKTVLIARSRAASDLREALSARRFYAVAQGYNDVRLTVTVGDAPMGSRVRRPVGQRLTLEALLSRDGADFNGRVELVSAGNQVIASGEGARFASTVTVTDRERYYFLRVIDTASGRPVAFSSPVWVLPGASPLPLCDAGDTDRSGAEQTVQTFQEKRNFPVQFEQARGEQPGLGDTH